MKYANATKDTWRGWAWNQIESRIGRSRHYDPKTVCVLAGDCAGDLPHAKRRGFECIGIDVDQSCVKTFREHGGIAVNGSLQYQVVSIKPHAVIADMLGGINAGNAGIFIDSALTCDAVVMNLLRGRDKGMFEWHSACKTIDYSSGKKEEICVGKHRGAQMLMTLAIALAQQWKIEPEFKVDTQKVGFVPKKFMELFRPCFYSYRSKDGKQWFDSVAVTTKWIGLDPKANKLIKEVVPKKQLQRAAAAKALITMRRNKG